MGKHSKNKYKFIKSKKSKGKHNNTNAPHNHKKTRKKQKRKLMYSFLQIICIILIIYSAFNIYKWYDYSKNIEKEYNDITNLVKINTSVDSETTFSQSQENEEDSSNPYTDLTKINLIDVDFSELEKINSDVTGWIQVPGTNINYPYLQTTNNEYYLSHSFMKNYNKAGWVFLDYRNNSNLIDKNTIIYAHSRLDQSMFGSLKNSLTQEWYNNINNHIIYISTKNKNTLWQIFSIYHIPTTSDYLRTTFNDNSDFTEFAQMLQTRSIYNFNSTINSNDKIITLSTCYGKTERLVIHAKLIKYSNKSSEE
jgi:sortase B